MLFFSNCNRNHLIAYTIATKSLYDVIHEESLLVFCIRTFLPTIYLLSKSSKLTTARYDKVQKTKTKLKRGIGSGHGEFGTGLFAQVVLIWVCA